jgi:hypothetical protein
MAFKDKDVGKKYYAEYREKNRDKLRAYYTAYRAANTEKINENSRKYSAKLEAKKKYREYCETNKENIAVRRKKYRETNREKIKDGERKSRYGIGREKFDELFDGQGGACAICRQPFDRTPQVDHEHEGGGVRGLLCSRCNLGLGYFQDNPNRLEAAAEYVRQSREILRNNGRVDVAISSEAE